MNLLVTVWDKNLEALVWIRIKDAIWNNLYNFASAIISILVNVWWNSDILEQFCYYNGRLYSWINSLAISEKFLLFIKENRVIIEDLLESKK